jgi:hypothetical protein
MTSLQHAERALQFDTCDEARLNPAHASTCLQYRLFALTVTFNVAQFAQSVLQCIGLDMGMMVRYVNCLLGRES